MVNSIGIDVGTSNTCVFAGDEPLYFFYNQITISTTVRLEKGGKWMLVQPGQSSTRWAHHLRHSKRILGRTPKDGALTNDVGKIEHATMRDHAACFNLNDEYVFPEAVLAFIFAKIREKAEATLKHIITECVVAVPAQFTCDQRNAMRVAAQGGGFKEVGMVEEPVAAAIQHVHMEKLDKSTVLVVDVGGGTTDLTIIRSETHGEKRSYLVKGTNGCNTLGGMDLTWSLADAALDKWGGNRDDIDRQQLFDECEHKKIQLADPSSQEVTITLYSTTDEEPPHITMSQTEFERLCEPFWNKVFSLSDTLFSEPGLSSDNLTSIIKTGGTCYLPSFERICKEKFPGVPIVDMKPDECVARGAALASNPNTHVTMVLPRSLGIEAFHEGKLKMEIIMNRNRSLPAEEERDFQTWGGQKSVKIAVYEGESSAHEDNIRVATYDISGFRPKNGLTVKVHFKVSEPGCILVTAKVANTTKTLTIKPSERFDENSVAQLQEDTTYRMRGEPIAAKQRSIGSTDTHTASARDDQDKNEALRDVVSMESLGKGRGGEPESVTSEDAAITGIGDSCAQGGVESSTGEDGSVDTGDEFEGTGKRKMDSSGKQPATKRTKA